MSIVVDFPGGNVYHYKRLWKQRRNVGHEYIHDWNRSYSYIIANIRLTYRWWMKPPGNKGERKT